MESRAASMVKQINCWGNICYNFELLRFHRKTKRLENKKNTKNKKINGIERVMGQGKDCDTVIEMLKCLAHDFPYTHTDRLSKLNRKKVNWMWHVFPEVERDLLCAQKNWHSITIIIKNRVGRWIENGYYSTQSNAIIEFFSAYVSILWGNPKCFGGTWGVTYKKKNLFVFDIKYDSISNSIL